MNHAVEKIIWQTRLGMEDQKVTQEAITTVQATENESPNWGVGQGERFKINKSRNTTGSKHIAYKYNGAQERQEQTELRWLAEDG